MDITAAQATKAAADYYKSLSEEMVQLSVEEIEKDNTENVWLITLGIAEMTYAINKPKNKEYKIFKVEVETGEVISMKIRTI
ncbi:hypothetical protein [Pseudoalteromonas phenolica]|uniref:hypothetical protein n=1 Tax=Pseudoalteromonas phenolica TaxID=161398 RepID=UPI00384BD19D